MIAVIDQAISGWIEDSVYPKWHKFQSLPEFNKFVNLKSFEQVANFHPQPVPKLRNHQIGRRRCALELALGIECEQERGHKVEAGMADDCCCCVGESSNYSHYHRPQCYLNDKNRRMGELRMQDAVQDSGR